MDDKRLLLGEKLSPQVTDVGLWHFDNGFPHIRPRWRSATFSLREKALSVVGIMKAPNRDGLGLLCGLNQSSKVRTSAKRSLKMP